MKLWRYYLEMTKIRIVFMVCVTAAIGFFLAPGGHNITTFVWMLIGTAFASGGASAINHCIERDTDALMERTRNRPVASGRIDPAHALAFGIFLVLSGVLILKVRVNLLSSFLVLLTAFLYVFVYTPLKRITWFNTFIGSVPGALPPMVGWAAAAGEIGLGAYLLFLILFAWQHPHFYALAWMFREDYERGGLKMLTVGDPHGRRTRAHVVVYSVILLVVSLLPVYFNLAGRYYFTGMVFLGIMMLFAGLQFSVTLTIPHARRLFRASLIYFPALLTLVLLDMKA